MNIKGKVALVTGGARRVGKAITLGLIAEGSKVAVHFHSSGNEAEELVTHIKDNGGEAIHIKGDFQKIADIESTVRRCHKHFGRLDILVNNAANYYATPLADTKEAQWDDLIDLNLKASFFCAKFAAECMREPGKIVNIADVAGIEPWPDYIPYCISKAGVISLTRGLAKALAPAVQVNAIASGTVLMGEDSEPELTRRIEEKTLLKRIGSPDDIVKMVLYLLKDGDYLTGAVIPVDGGSLLS